MPVVVTFGGFLGFPGVNFNAVGRRHSDATCASPSPMLVEGPFDAEIAASTRIRDRRFDLTAVNSRHNRCFAVWVSMIVNQSGSTCGRPTGSW